MKCRTAKGNITVTLYEAVADIPPCWDELLPENHFLKKGALDICEHAGLGHLTFIYALATDNGKAIAATSFQLLRFQEEHMDTAALKTWQRLSWKTFVKAFRPKLLVAGHLFRHDISSFYVDAAINDFNAYNIYMDLINTALKSSKADAMLLKDAPEGMQGYFQHYTPEFLLLRNDISMEMELDDGWQSFQDYEKDLKHKYAQRTRKVRSQLKGIDIRPLDAAALQQYEADIYRLYRQVSDHQQVRMGYLSKEYLPMLKSYYGEQIQFWGFFGQDKMIAFASAWVKESNFDMFYIGFDYERNNELQLYFNILFFSLEQAIHFRKKKLILGRTALEAKARLGCKPQFLHTFLYIRNPLIRRFVAGMQLRLQQAEGEWENRHPFKIDNK